ncbi:hypothetical protein ACFL02_02465 [Planctomycetota bacterium]
MIDFPFPEILIPKINMIVFIVQAFYVIAYEKYYSFFIKSKRLYRAKAMRIDAPIDKLQEYAIQSNSSSTDKTNLQVIMEFLVNYINTNSKDNPQWKFKREEIDDKALELLPDIPPELKSSFISYSIKMFVMDKTERYQTIKDALGYPAEGSKIYEISQKIIFWLLPLVFIFAIIIRSQEMILPFIYMLMGILVGYFLVKVSKVEARWQMWHSVIISVLVLLVLNGIDGYVTANTDLKNVNFPIVKIIKSDGEKQVGVLLGSFTDSYVIIPYEQDEFYRLMKINKQSVESISWTTFYVLNKDIEKMKIDLENQNILIEELRKKMDKEENLKKL